MKKKASKKVAQLTETAKNLFIQYGIRRVSIEEICKIANVSKMTFYKYFCNKTDLMKYILEKIWAESMQEYHSIMNQDMPYPEKVRQIIQLKIRQSTGISQEFLQDYFENADSELREYIQNKSKDGIQLIMDDLIKAQQNGHIRQDIRPEFIHYILNHLIELTKDEKLLRLYTKPEQLIFELTNFFFYGIIPDSPNQGVPDAKTA